MLFVIASCLSSFHWSSFYWSLIFSWKLKQANLWHSLMYHFSLMQSLQLHVLKLSKHVDSLKLKMVHFYPITCFQPINLLSLIVILEPYMPGKRWREKWYAVDRRFKTWICKLYLIFFGWKTLLLVLLLNASLRQLSVCASVIQVDLENNETHCFDDKISDSDPERDPANEVNLSI